MCVARWPFRVSGLQGRELFESGMPVVTQMMWLALRFEMDYRWVELCEALSKAKVYDHFLCVCVKGAEG